MIGVDWGTTSFRAFRIEPSGRVRDRRASPRGILAVQDGRFSDTLREEIGPWLAGGEDLVLLCGMIGSRQGWYEAPYIPCPAGVAELAAALVDVPFDWAQVKLIPGVAGVDDKGVAEMMRGEETQILGANEVIGERGLACLPGTHAKWARIEHGRIIGFATYMTGEVFAALRGATILGRTMRDAPPSEEAFDQGLQRSADPGGLLHHLFGVRALTLRGQLSDTAAASYLSGLLIGHEVRAALPEGEPLVHVIGAPELAGLYARAIAACGGQAVVHEGDTAAVGLAMIGERARWQ